MDTLELVGVVALVLVKESGLPLPVPGDLIIIGLGASVSGDVPGAGIVLGLILVAGFIGATFQFFLFGTALRRPLLASLNRLGISRARLERLSDRFRRHGTRSLAIARMTPGLRIAVIPAAAISGIPYLMFLAGIAAGNAFFVSAHFGLGFFLGAYARELISRYGGIVTAVVILIVAGVAGWFVLRSRRRASVGRSDTYECWADCSCPACVAIVSTLSPDLS